MDEIINYNAKDLRQLKADIGIAIDKTYEYLGASYEQKRVCNRLWTDILSETDRIIQLEHRNTDVMVSKYKDVMRLVQLDYSNGVIDPFLKKVQEECPNARNYFLELHRKFFEYEV